MKGFILVPVLVFVLVTITAGGIGFAKILDIEMKIKQQDAAIQAELGQLYLIHKDEKALKEKTENYSKLGIFLPEIGTAAASIRQFILEKNFPQAQNLLTAIDKKLEEALSVKKEAEKKVALGEKINLENKVSEFVKKGVNVAEVDKKLPDIRSLIDSGEYEKARSQISQLGVRLDQLLSLKLKEERKEQERRIAQAAASTAVSQNIAGIQYLRKTVTTARGNFTVDVLTVDLTKIQVVTDTANDADCDNNCPTKPLSQFVAERSGIAGINGTYFCPPDYASCAGKVASYDFPVYNTILGKFINGRTLFWSGRAMMAFDTTGGAHFFKDANNFGGINVKAAIVNYPALIAGGQIVVDEGALSPNLGQVKGARGALGFSGNILFAVVGRQATVGDMAYVMVALGAQNAMNLDGGGSSALFFAGNYKVGPGRNLPNAIIFAR